MTLTLTRRRVIVGVDESAAGMAALKWALTLARSQPAELIAVRAWLPAGHPARPSRPARWRGLSPRSITQRGQRGRRGLGEQGPDRARLQVMSAFFMVAGGIPEDVPVLIETPEGRPARVLARWACREGDILVVGAGSGSRTRLRRGRGGSVRRYCVAHASAPVVAVPAPDEAGRVPGNTMALRSAAARPAVADSAGPSVPPGQVTVTPGQGRTAPRPVTSVRGAVTPVGPTMSPERRGRL
jgi:nucleotide-binding universal stress UspA family protein